MKCMFAFVLLKKGGDTEKSLWFGVYSIAFMAEPKSSVTCRALAAGQVLDDGRVEYPSWSA